ncbi:MAG TPA: type II toxin-antitoxin system VapC family toxin [Oceanipulchritudo sp.]|nr:type II toxin-antitoxin system VapC family toxin [Oceanipulchritudo sp.]
MIFWDSSALTPLLLEEAESDLREAQLGRDSVIIVWYGTLAEIESALNRRKREGSLPRPEERKARARLNLLAEAWIEVQPTAALRDRALRLLRTHPLRAADAFQLAAAVIFCEDQTTGFPFLTGDHRLRDAAEAEGFTTGSD